MRLKVICTAAVGAAAGAVNGLFGAGGGMILVPLLQRLGSLDEEEIFPASISIILPLCIVSMTAQTERGLPWDAALPYLIGSILGGTIAGLCGKKIPVLWLHRILGALILWAGWRYLC